MSCGKTGWKDPAVRYERGGLPVRPRKASAWNGGSTSKQGVAL
ncbi:MULTISPECIES: hypothetical protein [unclassified Bacillus (in: firmicutes)]|nr:MULTISPECIES: hypothetical protein [unclassified Bacillus (in: firmicutes)]